MNEVIPIVQKEVFQTKWGFGQCTHCEKQIDSEPTCKFPRRHFSSVEEANKYPTSRTDGSFV